MSGSFNERDELEIGDGKIICCFGKKGSGKSVIARMILDSYPGDRIVLAANRDDGPFPNEDQGIHVFRGGVDDFPKRWPEHLRRDREYLTLRFEFDTGSSTDIEDQDAVVELAMRHGNCALLVHEVGLLAPVGKQSRYPFTKRLLHANRHHRVTALFCGPRPIDVNPLVIGQADVVYVFETQVVADRKRIADTIGWNLRDFEDGLDELGPHEYLRFDAREPKPEGAEDDRRLVIKPALPIEEVRRLP